MPLNVVSNAVTTHILPNGLTVLLHPMATTDVVTVDIWVRAGGRHESADMLGISHFLEHMVFKGTERLGPGVLDRVIEGRGGITNAATGHDFTHYYITVAAPDLAETLPYLAEVVMHAAIPDSEFERERQVVLEEIRRAEDNPDHRAFQLLMQTAYAEHPYGRPVLGTLESLMQLTPAQMRQYHRHWYRPDNMTVVVVGQFEPTPLLAQLAALFAVATPQSAVPALPERPPLALETVQRLDTVQPRLEHTRLIMGWPGASVVEWEDACALEMLATILGEGRSSRLVSRLRESLGWVLGISSSSAVHQEPGLFYVSAYLHENRLERVEAVITAEVARLTHEPVTAAELQRAQRLLTNEFIFATESPSQLARVYGFYHLSGGLDLADRYLALVQRMTVEHLQAVATRYLIPDRYVITVLRPAAIAIAA